MKRALLALALLAGFAQTAFAQTGTSIEIDHPWARASAGKTAVAYLTIVNKGAADDRLLSASTPVAQKAEPHVTTDDKGVMRMRAVDGIDVKAGGTVELKPSGLHLMLMGLKAPLKAGQSFKLTLTFEKAGAIDTTVSVEKAGAMSGGAMGGGAMPGMKMD